MMLPMKLKTKVITAAIAVSIISLTGCTSISSYFRNRDFDYARSPVKQERPFKIPESINVKPVITPKLTVPDQSSDYFSNDSITNAKQSLLPPGYDILFDVNYVKQQQLFTVKTKTTIDTDNQAKLTVYEPYDITWNLVKNILSSNVDKSILKHDYKDKGQFIVHDLTYNKDYYVFLSHIKGSHLQTQVSLFNSEKKPLTDNKSNEILNNISNQLNKLQLSQNDLVSSMYGFIISKHNFKFQLYNDKDITSLVFVGNNDDIIKQLKSSIVKAGYKYIAYDKKDKTILINKGKSNYLLYLYTHMSNGPIFSDMTNWKNLFRSEQKQLRISVFNTKKVLLNKHKQTPILTSIASNIEL